MSDDVDCGCGWTDTEGGSAFLQCSDHRAVAGMIELRIGRDRMYQAEYTVRAEMDTEIDDRLRKGLRGVDRPPAPRAGRGSR